MHACAIIFCINVSAMIHMHIYEMDRLMTDSLMQFKTVLELGLTLDANTLVFP